MGSSCLTLPLLLSFIKFLWIPLHSSVMPWIHEVVHWWIPIFANELAPIRPDVSSPVSGWHSAHLRRFLPCRSDSGEISRDFDDAKTSWIGRISSHASMISLSLPGEFGDPVAKMGDFSNKNTWHMGVSWNRDTPSDRPYSWDFP